MSGGADSSSRTGKNGDDQKDLDGQLEKAKLGDVEAFPPIYDEYVTRIYNFVFRMVNSREDAEEITQDTFFLAYANLKYLRENAHFEPWLYRIARNEVYKRKRKDKVKSSSLDDDKGILQILASTDFASNPEGRLLSEELGTHVEAALDSLPFKYKETLILAVNQGLSYKEISEIVGRSVAAVKTDVYRARLMIMEKMKKYYGG